MTTMMSLAVMALTVAFTGGLVEWMARRRSPQRLLFIALGREVGPEDEARRRRLRVGNAILTLLGLAAVFSGEPVLTAIGVQAAPLLSTLWLSVEVVLTARSARRETIPGRYTVSLDDTPGLAELVSAPLQVGNVLAVLIPFAMFAWLAGQLPASIPVHWDASGAVNGFASPASTATLGATLVFDLALLWFVLFGISRERWAMPEEGGEQYMELSVRRRRLLVRMTEWIILAVNAGIGLIWMGLVVGGLPGWGVFGIGCSVVATVLILAGVGIPMFRILPQITKVQDALRSLAGTEVLGTRPDGWRLGGMVYYAPEDPALFVPKRVGIGQTFNFARPMAWVILVAILVVPLLMTWVSIS
ncbi:MAG: DUF5808 domain-containing protein [Sandaracinaceae bacterium]